MKNFFIFILLTLPSLVFSESFEFKVKNGYERTYAYGFSITESNGKCSLIKKEGGFPIQLNIAYPCDVVRDYAPHTQQPRVWSVNGSPDFLVFVGGLSNSCGTQIQKVVLKAGTYKVYPPQTKMTNKILKKAAVAPTDKNIEINGEHMSFKDYIERGVCVFEQIDMKAHPWGEIFWSEK